MNSIQILALFFVGLLTFSGVVAFLTVLGLPLIGAFLVVYVSGVLLMAGMQRRARECAESELTTEAEQAVNGRMPRIYGSGQLFKVQ